MPDEVKVEKTISGYNLTWTALKIEAKINRIRVSSDGITGFIEFILGKSKQIEPAFKFNFSSAPTRKQLFKTLSEKYTDPLWTDEVWTSVVDELIRQVSRLSQDQEDWSVIQPTVSGVKHPGYYIEPVIVKGVPNVIYGDKASLKTTVCLMMLGLLANGVDDSLTGLVASCTAKGAMLDWENNKNLTDYTTSRLVEGMTVPYFELAYMRCRHPFSEEIERIGRFVDANKPEVILIDSLGKAAGSIKFDSAGKDAALRMFEALDQFPNVTWVIIGQNAKGEEGKKTIFGSTFYTYYSRNIFRLQRSKEAVSKDELIVALIHEESNYSGTYPPIGFRATFTDSTIKIEHEETNMSQFMDRVSLTQDLFKYLESGAKSVKAISDELALSDNRVRTLLSQLKKRGKVINLGSGLWGLVSG